MFGLSMTTVTVIAVAAIVLLQAPRLLPLLSAVWKRIPAVPTTATANHESCKVEAVRLCEQLEVLFRDCGGDVSKVPFAEAIKLHSQEVNPLES